MKWLSRFLCPTELDRTRAAEAGARTRRARTLCAGAMGGRARAGRALAGAGGRSGCSARGRQPGHARNGACAAPHHPEVHAAASQLFVLLVIGAGVAIDGGPTSSVLSWLVSRARSWPLASAARWWLEGAGLTALVCGDCARRSAAVADDPSPLIATMALLGCVTAVTSALVSGEIFHRGRAVLDPLTGLLNRSTLESRLVEIEQQVTYGGSVSLVVSTSTTSSR